MVSLNVSITENKALNQDGITALRSLSLVQGQTYDLSVSLFSGFIQVAPTLSNFSFVLSDNRGASLVSQTSISAHGSGYLFSLPLVSPALGFSSSYSGSVSFTANGTQEIIEPFTIALAPTALNGNTAGYIASLNNLTSDVIIAGGGSVSVSQSGQTISIFGDSPTGSYYPLNSNPSGYLTSSSLNLYALQSALNATGTGLQGQLNILNGQSGSWYPKTNPSGYLSSIPSDVVRTSGNQTISGNKTFANEAFFPSGASGVFYGDGSHLSGVGASNAVLLTGNQTISGRKDFQDGITVDGDITNNGLPLPQPFEASGTLTKIVDTSATQAYLVVSNPNWRQVVDGDVITINVEGNSQDFTFRASPAGGNDVALNYDNNDGASLSMLIMVVTSIFGAVLSTVSNSNDGFNNLILATTDTGSTASIIVSGTVAGNVISASANGTDSIHSGTNYVTLKVGVAGVAHTITNIIAQNPASTSWTAADIEIGFFDGSTFTPIYKAPLSVLTGGSDLYQYLGNGFIVSASAFASVAAMQSTFLGQDLAARTAISASPGDETTGDDVTFFVIGTTY